MTTQDHNRTFKMMLNASERLSAAVRFFNELEHADDTQQEDVDIAFDDIERSIKYLQRRLETLKIDYNK